MRKMHQDAALACENKNGDPLDLDLVMARGLDTLGDMEGGPDLDQDSAFAEFELPDDEDCAVEVAAEAPRDRSQKEPASPPRAPVDTSKESTVYQRLIDYGLLRKITDIALAKVSIPWHLRDDATQEIHTAWAGLIAKPNFARNQLAHYAYITGQHAALKLRRTIGAVVTIPGAAFRTGRDTTFMEAIGAAVNPKDVDDFKDSLELSIDQEMPTESWITERFFLERMEGLTLSAKQRQVAFLALVKRQSSEEISIQMEMPIMYVERLLNQVTAKIEARDVLLKKNPDACKPKPPAKKGRKPRLPKESAES